MLENDRATKAHDLNALTSRFGGTVQHRFTSRHGQTFVLVSLPEDADPAQLERVAGKRGIAVHPNHTYQLFGDATAVNDPDFPVQWALHNDGTPFDAGHPQPLADADIDAPEAWQISVGSPEVVVAVLDTGVDYTHPDLAGNMWRNPGEIPGNGQDDDGNGFVDDVRGWDFPGNSRGLPPDNDPLDTLGHGTHVAGIIGAVTQNGIGIAGTAPKVRIMPVKVFNTFTSSDYYLAAGIDYAVANGAHVINASWGSRHRSELLYQAIERAREEGVLFVCASGNDSLQLGNDMWGENIYPAAFRHDNQVTVAATAPDDRMTDFSNFSELHVHLAAPGAFIRSTLPGRQVLFHTDFDQTPEGSLPEGFRTEGEPSYWGVAATTRGGNANRALRADAGAAAPYRPDGDSTLYLPPIETATPSTNLFLDVDIAAQLAPGSQLSLERYRSDEWQEVFRISEKSQFFEERVFAKVEGLNLQSDGNSSIQLRLRWRASAAGPQHWGVEVDNLVLYHQMEDETDPSVISHDHAYGFKSGTSMATPFVAGAAALLKSHKPAWSMDAVRMALLNSGDFVAHLQDTTITGSRLNLNNLLQVEGGLAITTALAGRSLGAGDSLPLIWRNYEHAAAPTTMSLLQDGELVEDSHIDLTHSAGLYHWTVPQVTPGDRYQLRLQAGGATFTSETFAIRAMEDLTPEDEDLAHYLLLQVDVNEDGILVASELERFRGTIRLERFEIDDFSFLMRLTHVKELILVGQKQLDLPDLSTFQHLEVLLINECRVDRIPTLPPTLRELLIIHAKLEELGELPENLRELVLVDLPLTRIDYLPPQLEYLELVDLPITELPPLGESLEDIWLNSLPITHIPGIPKQVKVLHLKRLGVSSLPPIESDQLWWLVIDHLPIKKLAPLEATPKLSWVIINDNPLLEEVGPIRSDRPINLDLANNALTELPETSVLRSLKAPNNRLGNISSLDPGLSDLNLALNQIDTLPSLPPSLYLLDVSYNRIHSLPPLKPLDRLLELRVQSNLLRELPEVSDTVYSIWANNNQLTSLPPYPAEINHLDVSYNQLTSMPDFGDQRRSMIFASGNRLERIPDLGENLFSLAHFEGNPFDESAMASIDALMSLNLPGFNSGFPPVLSDVLTGTLFEPRKDGSFIDPLGLRSDFPVEHANVQQAPNGQTLVSWRKGIPAGHALAAYRIYRGAHILTETPSTEAILDWPATVAGRTELEIVPVQRDGRERRDLAATVTVPKPDFPGMFQERHFPAFDAMGFGWTELILSDAKSTIGATITAFDAEGEVLETAHPTPGAGFAGRVLTTSELFSEATLSQVARYRLATLPSATIQVQTGDPESASAIEPAQFGRYEGQIYQHRYIDEPFTLTAINMSDTDEGSVWLAFFNRDGESVGEQAIDLSAGQTRMVALTSLIPDSVDPGDLGHIGWQSEVPIAMWSHYREENFGTSRVFLRETHRPGSIRGLLPSPGRTLFLQNGEDNDAIVRFWAYAENGTLLSSISALVPAKQTRWFDAYSFLLDKVGDDFFDNFGWFRYESTHPINVELLQNPWYLGGGNSSFVTSGELIKPESPRSTILQAPDCRWRFDYETMLHLINENARAATVHVKLRDQRGITVAAKTLRIEPNAKLYLDAKRFAGWDGALDLETVKSVQFITSPSTPVTGYKMQHHKWDNRFTVHPLVSEF
ncbi:S8 family serine peptidase [Sulfidibacter corallicola]|uniref:S8 family serine peptidase n=1 Tax=Sulfidibacter corallicola TaxID=2818388 RepID=A0A8A4TKP3_SULCO|nr:S8 family serine peptidase [Sulfidibacter corallicola]QTD50047.1 S8 family serine peptidase [Sulfidibacter corallicola]